MSKKIVKSDREWKQSLSSEQYHILRKKGTEPPFSAEHEDRPAMGVYICAGCGNKLFRSDDKFESGTGWPSFTKPAEPDGVETKGDISHGMRRTEVLCSKCDGHLGHVFEDGPPPTGLRYCINSAALEFKEE